MAAFRNYSSESSTHWDTRKIAACALFCALAALATLLIEFPLIPGATWLKMDPSGIIAVLSGLLFGPEVALVVAALPNCVHIATESGLYGTFMAMLANVAIAVPPALIYKKLQSTKGLVLGLSLGSVLAVVLSILFNLVVTPLYLGMPLSAVLALIPTVLLPFNLAKVILTSLVSALIFPSAKALTKQM